ncbi:MAG: MFS transporter [Sphaerochaetaceae bacterium]|nr:MFS transporter [Sphaerochaetaceae bacterium]
MQDTRKAIISWSLYDWANSAFATTVMAGFFPIFFSSYWVSTSSVQISTFYLGLANSLEAILVAILAPILGAIADKGSFKKRFLIFFTFLGCVLTSSLWFVQAGMWQLAVLFYILATIGFSGSLIFYDALLPNVASPKKIDFVSSLGYSLGYIGGGILFLLNVLMYLHPSWFGLADEVAAIKASFVTVGIWWAVFSIPLILFVKEPKVSPAKKATQAIKEGLIQLKFTFKAIQDLKVVGLFLLAYWFYIDGVDTIIRMAVDYGTAIGFPASSLIVALLITQFVAFPSALAYNSFGQRIGIKKALLVAIGAYCFIAILGFFMSKEWHFYALACLIGLFQGGIQALSRSYYTRLIPTEFSGEFFGFFNMLGKFAAIIGPALLGIVTITTGSNRLGILSITILFIVGGLLLTKVNEEEGKISLQSFRTSMIAKELEHRDTN